MNRGKIIRLSIAGVLLCIALGFGTVSIVKTASVRKYAEETNACTEKINSLMKSDTSNEWNTPGTENYNLIKGWEKEREEANTKHNEAEENLPVLASISFFALFGLIFLGVDSLKQK